MFDFLIWTAWKFSVQASVICILLTSKTGMKEANTLALSKWLVWAKVILHCSSCPLLSVPLSVHGVLKGQPKVPNLACWNISSRPLQLSICLKNLHQRCIIARNVISKDLSCLLVATISGLLTTLHACYNLVQFCNILPFRPTTLCPMYDMDRNLVVNHNRWCSGKSKSPNKNSWVLLIWTQK